MEHGWSGRKKITGRFIIFLFSVTIFLLFIAFRVSDFHFSPHTQSKFFPKFSNSTQHRRLRYWKQVLMGIIRSCFSFIAGTVCGIYVAQNYQVPNITKLIDTTLHKAKEVEETYRKPKKKGSKDDDNYD
ncbi:hypothetical protein PIB30_004586 [Stylosanthes scabra]|uniref:Transmembrane protein n=1 Tax=Stylosanthes scabra TaxID=79078 RepID=A0ABU6Z0H8_9FABA|nr:hypothetical protein [Stylosanthes scabra]